MVLDVGTVGLHSGRSKILLRVPLGRVDAKGHLTDRWVPPLASPHLGLFIVSGLLSFAFGTEFGGRATGITDCAVLPWRDLVPPTVVGPAVFGVPQLDLLSLHEC